MHSAPDARPFPPQNRVQLISGKEKQKSWAQPCNHLNIVGIGKTQHMLGSAVGPNRPPTNPAGQNSAGRCKSGEGGSSAVLQRFRRDGRGQTPSTAGNWPVLMAVVKAW